MRFWRGRGRCGAAALHWSWQDFENGGISLFLLPPSTRDKEGAWGVVVLQFISTRRGEWVLWWFKKGLWAQIYRLVVIILVESKNVQN